MYGDAAVLRSVTEPERIAREFKRRVGDSTPMMIGGAPRSPESVMAVLLRAVVNAAVEVEGSQPDRVAITHPASWGQYKLDVLRQAIRLAELDVDHVLVPEPVAAAVHYATMQRVELNDFVAVYDLGGGTFDAAVVRRTQDGFDLYGEPEGIERLGGIDVDAAVFSHVQGALGLQVETLDRDDPAVMSAFARLRADCVSAKEALSSDTDAVIPVMLPGLATEVRITRSELETMIRPAIRDTIAALRRAITSGGLVPEHLARVLLVGGSSRIPLVAEMISAELGRPIALDAHPKHAVALGAAITAAPKAEVSPVTAPSPTFIPPVAPAPVVPPPVSSPPAASPPPTAPTPFPPFGGRPPSQPEGVSKRSPALIAAIVAVVLVLGGIAYAVSQSGGGSSASSDSSSDSTSDSSTDSSSDASGTFADTDAESKSTNFVETLFTFDSTDLGQLHDRLAPLVTTDLLSTIDGTLDANFSSSVVAADGASSGSVFESKVQVFNGDSGTVIVKASISYFDDSTESDFPEVVLVVSLTTVDGQLLVSDLGECDTDSSSNSTTLENVPQVSC